MKILKILVSLFAPTAVVVYPWVMYPKKPLVCGKGNKKIACVGDSITYSLGVLGKRKICSYPALLAEKLGDDYSTINYGLSSRTLLSTTDIPYFDEKWGKAAWDTDAEIVIFMLGSNDCKHKNWDADRFRTEYDSAIRHYLDAGKQLIIMTPPAFFVKHLGKLRHDPALLESGLRPIIAELAAQYNLPHVDLFTLTESHPEWFPDRLHPNKAGNIAIAQEIVRTVKFR